MILFDAGSSFEHADPIDWLIIALVALDQAKSKINQ